MNNAIEVLKREFALRRKRNPNLSLRSFARWLGISPAQASQVMSGKRRLTAKMASQVAKKIGLSPLERLDFVRQTYSVDLEFSGVSGSTKLTEDRFQIIAEWHHLAILSLTKIKGAKADPRWVARRLGIPVAEAQLAMERLCNLGLLQLKPFRQIGDPLNIASEVPSPAIRRHHKQLINLAVEALDSEPMARRQVQSVTFATDAKTLSLAQKHVDRFLDEMSQLLESSEPTDVYCLNLQLTPLTKKET